MTSSEFSSSQTDSDSSVCPRCGGPQAERPSHTQPILVQILFGISFVLFLWAQPHLPSSLLWSWTLAQIALGALLLRGRIRAKRRIYRCVRCTMPVR